MLIKLGENHKIEVQSIQTYSESIPANVLENFQKFAKSLKKIAPKANDFLYFTTVMMHAAEASAINEDGSPKLTKNGEPVVVGWDTSNDTWKWKTNDPAIKPYKNANHDIFPSSELVKAHKKWVGKPLCVDHKSNSVDHVRGFIVDTFYDTRLKRIVALCALDKKNYPDLARKVETGYSNDVSMGVGVARAICTDCARVARVESDFCNHMLTKSGYGEINVDLNPIELSIVVNGADPRAKIKQVLAAAKTLDNYVNDKKQFLINAQRTPNFGATFNFNLPGSLQEGDSSAGQRYSINTVSIDEFKQEVSKILQKLEQASKENSALEDNNNSEDDDNDGNNEVLLSDDREVSNIDFSLGIPSSQKFASANTSNNVTLLNDFNKVAQSIKENLSEMSEIYNKLSQNKEENMSVKKAYFNGTEEPKPGETQYPADPLNNKLREDGDRQMDVDDMGPVDGMHPGPKSVGMSELERKKMLARASVEESRERRKQAVELAKAALDKQSYFQGGGGVNEPTPGKTKYAPEKMNNDLRDEDHHMVGQKPFPGVGDVNKLHPSPASADVSDELKRKQMLRRADALKGRFVKASNTDGSLNKSKSYWEVSKGDQIVLKASVNELSGNQSELFYPAIATTQFGKSLINNIKTNGVKRVVASYKSAQMPNAPGPVGPPADQGAGMDMPMPEGAPAAEAPAEEKDPKQLAKDLSVQVKDLSSDLAEVVNELVSEQPEMGAQEAQMPPTTAQAFKMRREINGELISEMRKTIAQLNDHKEELSYIQGIDVDGNEVVNNVVQDAFADAKSAIADGLQLIKAFVKYAKGTEAMIKQAQMEVDMSKLSRDDEPVALGDEFSSDEGSDSHIEDLLNETSSDVDDLKDLDLDSLDEDEEHDEGEEHDHGDESEEDELEDVIEVNDVQDADVTVKTPQEAAQVTKEDPNASVKVEASFDLTTKSGRAAYRAKLAAESIKFSPMLGEAHPKGGFTPKTDVKPSGDLGHVEDLEERHDAMMDVATAPVKVRKEAETIQRLIAEGSLSVNDLDALVAEGLDKDAVSYYKKYFGAVDGGSEFASELVKEHAKAQAEQELEVYKTKLARAYELTYDMVSRGLCHNDRVSIENQVKEVMKCNDEGFNSFRKLVAKYNPIQKLASLPNVGIVDNNGINQTAAKSLDEADLYTQLSAALNSTKRNRF